MIDHKLRLYTGESSSPVHESGQHGNEITVLATGPEPAGEQLRSRDPEWFGSLLSGYRQLFAREQPRDDARQLKECLVTALGDARGGPRDLMDLHLAALDDAAVTHGVDRDHTLVFEARLIALEMMGLLVDYHRVGLRRYFAESAYS